MIGLKKFSGGFFRSVKVKSGKKYQNDRMDMCRGGYLSPWYSPESIMVRT